MAMRIGVGVCAAQSSGLPATQPTELPAAAVASPATPAPPASAAHPAKVSYTEGLLQVVADNSSLNQVLREIAHKTGMKITGGVGDERVFGTYGPGTPAKVLASLLDGTGSNMLLRESSSDAPAELILTPRGGGPTPPNPNAAAHEDDDTISNEDTITAPHWPTPPPVPPGTVLGAGPSAPPGQLPAGVGVSNGALPGSTTPGAPGVDAPSPGVSEPQSPNGVKTPQQIFQQLQQLQQQQQQPPKQN
jgi:hypothetical protein